MTSLIRCQTLKCTLTVLSARGDNYYNRLSPTGQCINIFDHYQTEFQKPDPELINGGKFGAINFSCTIVCLPLATGIQSEGVIGLKG